MKEMLPAVFLLSMVIGAGSSRLTFFQSYNISEDHVFTLWASLMIGDIETHAFYNDIRQIVYKQSWSKGNLTETDLMFYDMFVLRYFYYFQIHFQTLSKEVGIKIPATLQCQAGCVAYNEDPDSYFYRLAIDGEDLVYLNITDRVWVAEHNIYSQAVMKILQKDQTTIKTIYNILRNYLQKYSRILSVAGKEALSKKSKPGVYFFMRSGTLEAELICIATGFYPRSINITLWKDKENIMDNVTLGEILPNGDGTYQRRAIVTTGWGQQSTVYCQVEHSSLKEPLVKKLNMKHSKVTGLVIGTILGVVVCVTVLVWIVKKKKHRTYTSIAGRTMDRILGRTTDGNVSV